MKDNMENKYWFIIAGIFIGWITKAPFLLYFYRKNKADRTHINELIDNFKKNYPEFKNNPNK